MKWIAHVYLANFYTSVQLAHKPELSAESVLILKHNKVIDFNAQALDAGVKIRSSRRHARQCCPDGLFIDYFEEEYRKAAEETLNICLQYTPVIEPVAENEFYLELSGPHSPDQVVRELTALLVPEMASGLSVGIARNRFLARVANMALTAGRSPVNSKLSRENPGLEAAQFFWLKHAPGEEAAEFLAPLPVFYLWSLEEEVKQRLRHLGFLSIGELANLDAGILRKGFGSKGNIIADLAQGLDFCPVLALFPPQAITEEQNFAGGVSDILAIKQSVESLARRLAAGMESREKGCRRLILQAELEDGQVCATRSFNKPQVNIVTLYEVLKGLVDKLEIRSPVLALRVSADDLRPVTGTQLTLFEDPKQMAGFDQAWKNKLNTLLDALGKRFAPENFAFAGTVKSSRREEMLKLWDPLRFKEQAL